MRPEGCISPGSAQDFLLCCQRSAALACLFLEYTLNAPHDMRKYSHIDGLLQFSMWTAC